MSLADGRGTFQHQVIFMLEKLKDKKTKRIILIADVVILILLIAAVVLSQLEKSNAEGSDDIDSFYSRFIEHDGQVYPVKRNLRSVLLIGTDNRDGDEEPSEIETFYNDKMADYLILMVFDNTRKTVTPFQINRDTYCDVPWLSVNGLVGGYEPLPISIAHAFGSGGRDSSRNTVNAVTGLLYGAPVDHYFTFSMDTVPILNDLVGGVTVTLEDDIPALGEKYVKGATITLKGEEALRFVRTRSHDRLDANVTRMAHHRLYMNAFAAQAKKTIDKNPEFVIDAFDKVERFLNTDLTVENVSELVNHYYDYEVLPMVTPTGTYARSIRGTAEFHPDEDSLWDCVRSTFCP